MPTSRAILVPAVLFALACAASDRAQAQAGKCPPLETRPPNAPAQRPARPDQTRACAAPPSAAYAVTVVAKGLERPWAVEPLPDGALLVTERPGRLRVVTAEGEVGPPIAGLPAVEARDQGGLLDVALGPTFATDRTIYWSFTEPREGGNGTSVARGVLSADRSRVEGARVDLPRRARVRERHALRLAPRLRPRRHAVRHRRRALRQAHAEARPGPRQPPRARPSASAPTAASRRTTRSRGARARSRRSGPSATATCRPRPSTPAGGCGRSRWARRAATS